MTNSVFTLELDYKVQSQPITYSCQRNVKIIQLSFSNNLLRVNSMRFKILNVNLWQNPSKLSDFTGNFRNNSVLLVHELFINIKQHEALILFNFIKRRFIKQLCK